MATDEFQQFCASVSALVGTHAPALAPDARGLVGFTVTYEGVDVGFLERPAGGTALMMVGFGLPDAAQELQVLRDLMHFNAGRRSSDAPVFVRDPGTGAIALHQELELSRLDGATICRCVGNAAEAAHQWRNACTAGAGGCP